MKLVAQNRNGFTLIELLVVIAIIGILSAVVTANFGTTSTKSRDAQRQADLTNLQVAIEAYKSRFGVYPQGCNSAGNWSGQIGTNFACPGNDSQYIVGLAPDFIPVLPTDPKLPSGGGEVGYAYVVNIEGTVYKIIAMGTVESDELIKSGGDMAYSSPFKSCDMKAYLNADGDAWGVIYEQSFCGDKVSTNGSNLLDTPLHCKADDSRFRSSYALWGGFADLANGYAEVDFPLINNERKAVYKTTNIICK